MGSNHLFFSLGLMEVTRNLLDLEVFLKKKSWAFGILETWDHHHWMPVNYRDLISVPHLGSQRQPCWATCWGSPCSHWTGTPCSSARLRPRPQVWHINQVTILDRHSLVVVPGLWDAKCPTFFVRKTSRSRIFLVSSTRPGEKNKWFDHIPSIFGHILRWL